MTAAQLAHLAELAACGANYFARADPDAARIFGEAARRAGSLSAELKRKHATAERTLHCRVPEPVAIEQRLGSPGHRP
jgi:hypothetical protein